MSATVGVRTKPSLRWRLRRWVLVRLDAWPPHHVTPAPQTEWRRMRRRERLDMEREVVRLREEVAALKATTVAP